ncbi:MAG: hypothetical protein KKA70_05395 [Proteobacteria bacterium]|nr:hypothetical protein [Pseudomonadota bacterium]
MKFPPLKHLRLPLLLLILFQASPAWAVQPHGGLEGLVSHELGHALFSGGLIYLLIQGYLSKWHGPGWRDFKIFLCLVLLWNILTFTSHWMDLYVSSDQFVRSNGQKISLHIVDFSSLFYYLSKLDHLVLVPALIFLLSALKNWSQTPEEEK